MQPQFFGVTIVIIIKTYFDQPKRDICEKWGIPYIDLYDGGVEIEHKSYITMIF